MADIAAGMYAYSNILAALIAARPHGSGARLDVSMLEALAEWMGYPLYYAMTAQPPPPRAAPSHATIYPYGPFATGDGNVMLGLQNEREWRRSATRCCSGPSARHRCALRRQCAALSANRAALRALIEGVFASLTAEKCCAGSTPRRSPTRA
jgi:itaconate CoA-transferase